MISTELSVPPVILRKPICRARASRLSELRRSRTRASLFSLSVKKCSILSVDPLVAEISMIPAAHSDPSIPPEVVETIGCEPRVENRVLNILVPQVVLNSTGILTVVGQLEAGRMPEHVRVDRHSEPGSIAGASDHFAERRCGHRRFTFRDKDIRRIWIITQELAQRPQFWTTQ